MTVKLYFETLTEGMHAKLNSRYVPRKPVLIYNDVPSLLKVAQPKHIRTGFLEDAVTKAHYRVR